MSQELNSIIDELAKIDSASARIMRKTQDKKAKYAEYITQQKKEFDKKLEQQRRRIRAAAHRDQHMFAGRNPARFL